MLLVMAAERLDSRRGHLLTRQQVKCRRLEHFCVQKSSLHKCANALVEQVSKLQATIAWRFELSRTDYKLKAMAAVCLYAYAMMDAFDTPPPSSGLSSGCRNKRLQNSSNRRRTEAARL